MSNKYFKLIILFFITAFSNLSAVPTLILSSGNATITQQVCTFSPINTIVYIVGGTATNVTSSGLPAGVNGIYNSVNNQFAISGSATTSGSFNITVIATGGGSIAQNFTLIIKAIPVVNTIPNQSVCSGANTTAINFTGTLANTTFSAWSNSNDLIGLAPIGLGNIPIFTATNFSSSPITGSVFVTPLANGCLGINTMVTTIEVKPIPTLSISSTQSLCEGSSTAPFIFSSSIIGATINWTNSNIQTGLAASGSGNSIAPFIVQNPLNSITVSNLNLTVSANGCIGNYNNFTSLTVYPAPIANIIASQEVCNGGSISPINFTSPVENTIFLSWTNSNNTIGLNASGSGNIPSTIVFNSGIVNISAQISVVPFANGCTGSAIVVNTITIRPSPTVNTISNQTVCKGDVIDVNNFNSPNSNAQFNWNNPQSSIGLENSGNGQIADFVALNPLTIDISAQINVTATEVGCFSGPSITFIITVKAAPNINIIPSPFSICSGENFPSNAINSSINNTEYFWINDFTDNINLPLSGSAILFPSFVASNFSTNNFNANLKVYGSANGCFGDTAILPLVVLPRPLLSGFGNLNLCSGESSQEIDILSSLPLDGILWLNLNSQIGLPNSGSTATIPSFEAINTTDSVITGIIQLNATSTNGCVNTQTFSININNINLITNADFTINQNGAQLNVALIDSAGIESTIWKLEGVEIGTGYQLNYNFTQNGSYSLACIATSVCGIVDTVVKIINVSVGIADIGNYVFEAFPNPFQDHLFLNVEFIQQFDLEIINLKNQVVYQAYNQKQSFKKYLETDTLPKGIYILRINTENRTYFNKLIKI